MPPVCLSPEQIETLLKIFNEYGEKVLIIKNLIIMTTTDYSFGKFEVWVDIWPNFNAVLVKWDLTNTAVSRIKNYYYEFSFSDESFRKLLGSPGLFPLNQSEFVALNKERRVVLQTYAEANGYDLFCNDKHYDVFCLTEGTVTNIPAPTDLIVGTLTAEYADLVARNSEYTEEDSFDSYKEFIKLLITTYPNTCLFNSINQPVAYAVGKEYGGIGMLYVHPKYRGRGCAKAVISILSQKYLSKGITPIVVVDVKSILYSNLNTTLGYKSTQSNINTYIPLPKTQTN